MEAAVRRKQLRLIAQHMEDMLKGGKTALAVHQGVDSLGLALRGQTAHKARWSRHHTVLLVFALAGGGLLLYGG